VIRVSAPASGGGGASAGTYDPTLSIVSPTPIATVAAAAPFSWTRVGDVVSVAGLVDVTPSSNRATNEVDVSLPVASGSPASLAGVCTANSLPSTDALEMAGIIESSGANARVRWTSAFNNAPGPYTLAVRFSYVVTP
jgi:hypothetical protein